MANQKITDLKKLLGGDSDPLSSNDLLLVVDRDAVPSYGSSSTGETKAISASTLASELATLQQGDVGINLKNLADVPNEYTGFEGGYIKIKDDASGLEFTDAPGAAEISVNISNFDPIENYRVGDVITRGVISTGQVVYKKATSGDVDSAEAVGIIRKIKQVESENSSETEHYINIVFNGHIDFEELVFIENETLSGNEPPLQSELVDGRTYFLGTQGCLAEFDPSTSLQTTGVHVSKPMLIATGKQSGVIVNYRGLICEGDEEEAKKFIIEYTASCSDIKVGDIVRVKRNHQPRINSDGIVIYSDENPEIVKPDNLGAATGESPYVLSNAAAQKTDSNNLPDGEDAYASEILGMVIVATSDYFQIQTSGMIKFDKPTGVDKIFKKGYTYYLDAYEINNQSNINPNLKTGIVRNTIYDYTSHEISNYLSPTESASFPESVTTPQQEDQFKDIFGEITPFRNSTLHNPFFRRTGDGSVGAYSKPVFHAIDDDRIVLLDRPTYPSTIDTCNLAEVFQTETCFSVKSEERTFHVSDWADSETQLVYSEQLNSLWEDATESDLANIVLINFTSKTITNYKYQKISGGVGTIGGNWRKV
jgi:hypothetical protein